MIQRFEHTCERSHRFLRRLLAETGPARITALSFPALVRLGPERGPLAERWDVWTDRREARGTARHTFGGAEAAEVFARVPASPEDARAPLAASGRRLAP